MSRKLSEEMNAEQLRRYFAEREKSQQGEREQGEREEAEGISVQMLAKLFQQTHEHLQQLQQSMERIQADVSALAQMQQNRFSSSPSSAPVTSYTPVPRPVQTVKSKPRRSRWGLLLMLALAAIAAGMGYADWRQYQLQQQAGITPVVTPTQATVAEPQSRRWAIPEWLEPKSSAPVEDTTPESAAPTPAVVEESSTPTQVPEQPAVDSPSESAPESAPEEAPTEADEIENRAENPAPVETRPRLIPI